MEVLNFLFVLSKSAPVRWKWRIRRRRIVGHCIILSSLSFNPGTIFHLSFVSSNSYHRQQADLNFTFLHFWPKARLISNLAHTNMKGGAAVRVAFGESESHSAWSQQWMTEFSDHISQNILSQAITTAHFYNTRRSLPMPFPKETSSQIALNSCLFCSFPLPISFILPLQKPWKSHSVLAWLQAPSLAPSWPCFWSSRSLALSWTGIDGSKGTATPEAGNP